MHICQPLFWPLKIFQDLFLFVFFIFLQFSINYRWNNLLKCSNCFEANFISIHLFHDIPQTSCRIHRYYFLSFCFFFFVNMQLTSVFRYWCTFLLKMCLHYQYTTIFYIIYRPIIQHKRYISIYTDVNYQCHFILENLWFK